MNFAHMPSEYGGGDNTPGLIVVHAIGEFIDTAAEDYFAPDFLDTLGLSAHVFITPSGVPIRCRDDSEIAWHAKGFNGDSLGIEFLVPGLHTYSTFMQVLSTDYVSVSAFATGAEVIQNWISEHDITLIRKHSDLSPGRKVDPGNGFPWKALLEAVGVDENGEIHA